VIATLQRALGAEFYAAFSSQLDDATAGDAGVFKEPAARQPVLRWRRAVLGWIAVYIPASNTDPKAKNQSSAENKHLS